MLRVIAAIFAVVLAGCTPAQEEFWYGTPEERAANEAFRASMQPLTNSVSNMGQSISCAYQGGSYDKKLGQCILPLKVNVIVNTKPLHCYGSGSNIYCY